MHLTTWLLKGLIAANKETSSPPNEFSPRDLKSGNQEISSLLFSRGPTHKTWPKKGRGYMPTAHARENMS